MGSRIRSTLRQSLHSGLHALGVDIVRYEPSRFSELRRANLLAAERVDVLVDVGANDGAFGRSIRRAGYAGRIVSFEPQRVAFARLEATAADDDAWCCHRLALGSVDGEAVLHVAANSSSSSLLDIEEQHVRSAPDSAYVADEQVAVARLDSVCADIVAPGERAYLKVDVQGAELDVLRGGEEMLASVVVVDVELSLVPLYRDAPLLVEVLGHLERRGFVPSWLEPVFVDPATGRLLQVDGLFRRSP
jgi:FkbM family methyltransferase